MAFCRVVFPLLVLSIISSSASFVPVYIWGDLANKPVLSNPLTKVSSDEFDQILLDQVTGNKVTVVFVENTLSVEDFSLKNDQAETVFPYLHAHIGDAIYLPSVNDPVEAIHQIVPEDSADIKLTENGLTADIPSETPGEGRVVVIQLQDAKEGESRAELLKRHNDFIQTTYNTLKETNDKVLAVYTAENPSFTIPKSYSRSRRAADSTAMTYGLNGLRLYAKSIELKSGNSSTELTVLTATNTEINGTVMNTTMTFDNTSITLNFNQKGGYWFFNSVTLNVASLIEELSPNEEVFAIVDFSYRCQQHVSFSTVNESRSYTLSFNDLKIQPFFAETNSTQEFGDSFNCVGFFTAPIWAALFVVFILLAITFYGIMMMLDIRTMDRFDDPKGKTITINSE